MKRTIAVLGLSIFSACAGAPREPSRDPASDLGDLFVSSWQNCGDSPEALVRADVAKLWSFSRDPNQRLEFKGRASLPWLTTVRFGHFYNLSGAKDPVEVLGSESYVHRSAKGCRVVHKLARWSHPLRFSLSPRAALVIAALDSGARVESVGLKSKVNLKILPNLYRDDARVIYQVDLAGVAFQRVKNRAPQIRRVVFVDADTREVVANFPVRRSIAKIHVVSAENGKIKTAKYGEDFDPARLPKAMRDACQVVSMKKGSEGWPIYINPARCEPKYRDSARVGSPDPDADRAFANQQLISSYYATKFNRNSYDDRGADVMCVVHAGEDLENAFWDPDLKILVYGDGEHGKRRPYTLALDIAGHEFTHAVVSETAKFNGEDEPGAMDEAFADFFGIMISNLKDPDPDWMIGRRLYGDENEELALRSLAQPWRFKTTAFTDPGFRNQVEVPFPSKYSQKLAVGQKCREENDHCEVHGNATIPGHAMYRVSRVLEVSGQSIDKKFERAERLFYTVLTQKLNATDGFKQMARDTVEVCQEMFTPTECAKVASTLRQIELL